VLPNQHCFLQIKQIWWSILNKNTGCQFCSYLCPMQLFPPLFLNFRMDSWCTASYTKSLPRKPNWWAFIFYILLCWLTSANHVFCVCKHDSVSSNTYWIICDDVLWIYSEHVIASLSYLLQMDVEFLVSMRCKTFLSRQFIHATWSRASMDLND
jgi:hypothetical protein